VSWFSYGWYKFVLFFIAIFQCSMKM
jgi:hypothetical protein